MCLRLRTPTVALAGCLALLGTALPALGQVRTETRTETRTTTTEVRRVSTIIGSTVQLQAGSGFGKVEDIILNDRGCIEYLFLAHETNYLVVPWTVATVQFEQRVVVLDIARDRLLRAPTFARDRWTVFADVDFRRRVNTYYGLRGDVRDSDLDERRRDIRRDSKQSDRLDPDRREERREERPRTTTPPKDPPPDRTIDPKRPPDKSPPDKPRRPADPPKKDPPKKDPPDRP
jgi:hypothetical protein